MESEVKSIKSRIEMLEKRFESMFPPKLDDGIKPDVKNLVGNHFALLLRLVH